MSEPLSREELEFLARFARLPEVKMYLRYLEAKLGSADADLRSALREGVFVAQGRSRAFHELLQDIKEAEQRLNRPAVSRPRVVNHPQA